MKNDSDDIDYASFTLRLRAMLLDGVFILAIFYIILIFLTRFENIPSPIRTILLALPFVLEPLLVFTVGGTLGHLSVGIRVVDANKYQNITFFRSLIRSIVKTFLGLPSFILMTFSKKYQAIHDRCANSVVIVANKKVTAKHRISAKEWEKIIRAKESPLQPASLPKRIIAIFVWGILSFILAMVLIYISVSHNCFQDNQCSKVENTIQNYIMLIEFSLLIMIIILGLKSRLLGARGKH